jgi:hypothetical protein
MSGNRPDDETVILGDSPDLALTEAIVWHDDDGPHVTIAQHFRRTSGVVAVKQLIGVRPQEIAAFAALFGRLRDEASGYDLRDNVRNLRRHLADFRSAGGGDSNDDEIEAACELAGDVDALLCGWDRTASSLGDAAEVFCTCGARIEQHDGVWLHTRNPDIIGHDDEYASPEDAQ